MEALKGCLQLADVIFWILMMALGATFAGALLIASLNWHESWKKLQEIEKEHR